MITFGARPDPGAQAPERAPEPRKPDSGSWAQTPAARGLGALAALLGVGYGAHQLYRANRPKQQWVKGRDLYYR